MVWVAALPMVSGAPALARFEAIELARVPADARKAAEAGAPGVTFTRAAREVTQPGTPFEKTFYKLTGDDTRGGSIGVHVGTDNRLYGVDKPIAMPKVSKAAAATFKARRKELPRGFKVVRVVERSNYGSPIVFIYEGKDSKGVAVQVMISPDGKQLQVKGQDD